MSDLTSSRGMISSVVTSIDFLSDEVGGEMVTPDMVDTSHERGGVFLGFGLR